MSAPAQTTLVRRSFLSRLATVASGLASLVVLPSRAAAQSSAARSGGPTHPADAWLDDLKGQHKNIYDCTSIENGAFGWTFARNFLTANTGPIYQLKDTDLNAIVCVRHSSTVFGFNDEMWTKYKLGESQKVNEAGVPALKNPHANLANELAKRGVIVAVCGMATTRIARAVAASSGMSAADVESDLKANLVTPTARVVAAGVVVTNRAQEKGFTYTYVG
jgi:intracellular sulfur oxidation DsrE/DsrF family protein